MYSTCTPNCYQCAQNTFGSCIECNIGYEVDKTKKCQFVPLEVVSVSLVTNEKNNKLTIQLNRAPFEQEAANLNLQLDGPPLIESVDYIIVSQNTIDNKIIFEINMPQNRKISLLKLTLSGVTKSYTVENYILYTETYIKSSQQSAPTSKNMDSMSQALTPQEGVSKSVVEIIKQMQLAGMFSNFVSILGPTLLFWQSLPQAIQIGSAFGAFVFKDIPPIGQIIIKSDQNSTNSVDYNQRIFLDLSLKYDIFESFLFPHVLLQTSCLLCLLCMLAKRILEGKSYSKHIDTVIHLIINNVSSMQQGFITPSLFSIFYSIKFSDDIQSRALAIWQLILNFIFLIEMSFIILKRDCSFIQNNTPNLILNIDTQIRGWRSYILWSYFKKYFCIIIIVTCFSNPKVACIIIVVIFFVSTVYLAIFRFFTNTFLNIYKPLQELCICITFSLLAICISKQEDILKKSIVSNEELESLDKLSTVVQYMFIACLLFSFILFAIRTIVSIILLYKTITNKLKEHSQKQNFITFQIPDYSFSSVTGIKKYVIPKYPPIQGKHQFKKKQIRILNNLENKESHYHTQQSQPSLKN